MKNDQCMKQGNRQCSRSVLLKLVGGVDYQTQQMSCTEPLVSTCNLERIYQILVGDVALNWVEY